jgi:hypothetical protein
MVDYRRQSFSGVIPPGGAARVQLPTLRAPTVSQAEESTDAASEHENPVVGAPCVAGDAATCGEPDGD